MKPYLNIQEAIRDFSDRIEKLEATLKSEREKEMDDVGLVVNMQMVGSSGDVVTVMMPATRMGKREALIHAAWLVALADENDEFDAILRAVRNT